MTVSTMMHGEYGIDDVCLSVLCTAGRKGIQSKVMLPLADAEVKLLQHSAEQLKAIIKNTNI